MYVALFLITKQFMVGIQNKTIKIITIINDKLLLIGMLWNCRQMKEIVKYEGMKPFHMNSKVWFPIGNYLQQNILTSKNTKNITRSKYNSTLISYLI